MEEMLRQVLVVFAEEFHEQSQAITDALLRAERTQLPGDRKALMAEVFRHAHSIKGNAGTLGLNDLEQLAHAMETSLSPARSGLAALRPDVVAAVLRALDQAHRRVQSQLGGNDLEDPLLKASASFLLALSAGAEAVGASGLPPALSPLPPAAPPPPGLNTSATVLDAPPGTVELEGIPRSASETLRVSIQRLSALDRNVDELREVRAAFEHRAEEARRLHTTLMGALQASPEGGLDAQTGRWLGEQLQNLHRTLARDVGELAGRLTSVEEELRTLRMLPVETILAPLNRAVWEQARSVGKAARLELSGTQVALDRRLLNELKDPIVHLARNAVDHGIERPEDRVKVGKPREGVVRIQVEQRGNQVLMTFSDDGAGVNLDAVRRRAVERKLLTDERAARLTEHEVHNLLFTPGFSTATEVTLTSGRGVGLDVVRENVQKIGGRVTVTSVPGVGTRFLLELPLTLATAQVLAFEASGMTLTLPLQAVMRAEYLAPGKSQARSIDVEGQILPLHSLAKLLGLPQQSTVSRQSSVIIARGADKLLALKVDRLLGEREVVIRPNPPELSRLRHLSAAAALGDGRLAFVLSLRALAERAQAEPIDEEGVETRTRRRVLVVDDSITTRALHKQVLETAGFFVLTASDGEEALRMLRSRGADVIVSDVRMPRMDGLALTRALRRDPQISHLPVILVSSLDSDEDRRRADEAGASAYLPKTAYERGQLLSLVQSLLAS